MKSAEQRAADEMAAQDARLNEGATGLDPVQFETLAEFISVPPRACQIAGLDPGASIVVVFGPPKCGKTFAICDLTMHVAHGMNWHAGFQVRGPLRVAYLAGEGTAGLRVRLRAWMAQHSELPSGEFIVLRRALSLPDKAQKIAERLTAFRPDIVVVDTLNAFFGAGSENDTETMTNFMNAIRYLRDTLGSSIYVIHHTGHGDQTRERGSNVLRASADVLVRVARFRSGNFGFQIVGARDIDTMDSPLALRLRQVEVDLKDEAGARVQSCVVELADVANGPAQHGEHELGDAQKAVLDMILDLSKEVPHGGGVQVKVARTRIAGRAKELKIDRRRVWQSLQRLQELGYVVLDGKEFVSLVLC
jgi:hypothetical protein